MRERVLSLSGKFDLISSPGAGTKIIVSLPLETSA
jgi:signal transduction histidine kinase